MGEAPKFTPGPWRIEPNAAKGAWIGGVGTNEWAALALGADDETAKANANLVAAAPELYAALSQARFQLETAMRSAGEEYAVIGGVLAPIDAALAKAVPADALPAQPSFNT